MYSRSQGAFLFAVYFRAVLASFMRPEKVRAHHTYLVNWLGKRVMAGACGGHYRTGKISTSSRGGARSSSTRGDRDTFLGGEFIANSKRGICGLRAHVVPQDASY